MLSAVGWIARTWLPGVPSQDNLISNTRTGYKNLLCPARQSEGPAVPAASSPLFSFQLTGEANSDWSNWGWFSCS